MFIHDASRPSPPWLGRQEPQQAQLHCSRDSTELSSARHGWRSAKRPITPMCTFYPYPTPSINGSSIHRWHKSDCWSTTAPLLLQPLVRPSCSTACGSSSDRHTRSPENMLHQQHYCIDSSKGFCFRSVYARKPLFTGNRLPTINTNRSHLTPP